MRIVVNGQQAFGAAVLKALLERGEEVVGVLCAPDKPGRPADPLRQAAEESGILVRQPASFKTPEAPGELAELQPDLMVMAFVTLFIPEPVLNTPTHGSIQYHPSLLPRHRGPSAINWAIIQGDRTTGLSIFWPDEGLDTGPVLLTKEVPIEDDDTLGSLYFDKLFPLGVDAMLEAVDMVREGRAPRVEQDESQATYESFCRKDDVRIDWSADARRVYDLIRGANPRPGAWTTRDGQQLEILDVAPAGAEVGGSPGEVLDVGAESFTVAAGGGAIEVRSVREDGDRTPAGEYAERTALAGGAVLGAG